MSHGPSQYTLEVATPAELAGYAAAFADGDTAYVESLKYAFTFAAGSARTVDNVAVINGPGGVGRWLAQGSVTVFPTGVAATDDAALAAAALDMAGVGAVKIAFQSNRSLTNFCKFLPMAFNLSESLSIPMSPSFKPSTEAGTTCPPLIRTISSNPH